MDRLSLYQLLESLDVLPSGKSRVTNNETIDKTFVDPSRHVKTIKLTGDQIFVNAYGQLNRSPALLGSLIQSLTYHAQKIGQNVR